MNKLKNLLSLLLSLLLVMSSFFIFDITALALGSSSSSNFITFSSSEQFTITATKTWEGTIEYSTNGREAESWTVYTGGAALTSAQIGESGDYYLCFRGTGNTKMPANTSYSEYGDYTDNWIIEGTSVACNGNIENLLDYYDVFNGIHPVMDDECFLGMFYGCTALVKAPELPATTLSSSCYYSMFKECTSLQEAPALPATTLAASCYSAMFYGCASLQEAPVLPATTLASYCYSSMFNGCTSLRKAPVLPATSIKDGCYNTMFSFCTSLTEAPALPATTLGSACYTSMFNGCTALRTAPELPAMTLTSNCYSNMFTNCKSLIALPKLPATTLADYCYCTMFINCTGIKLYSSSSDAGSSPIAWCIPDEATEMRCWNLMMFSGIGSESTINPVIGTTYYYPSPVHCLNAVSGETAIDIQKGIVVTAIKSSTNISDIIATQPEYTVTATPSLIGTNYSYNGTGTIITVKSDTVTVDTYILSVNGDANGDSVCDVFDCMITEQATNTPNMLYGSKLTAIDYNENGSVDSTDFQQVINCALEV